MNGRARRSKGARGERELFRLLSGNLGFVVRRNVDQARSGGADGIEIPGWAVECKRQETLRVTEWMAQAETQAEAMGRKPVLFYRQSRHGWSAMMRMRDMHADLPAGAYAVMDIDAACEIIRESLT